MVKGKNKGGKKQEAASSDQPPTEGQPAESQPSTSQTPAAESVVSLEEDFGGLGLGEGRKRKPKKKAAQDKASQPQPARIDTPTVTEPETPKPEVTSGPSQSDTSKAEPADDDGLGLGGPRKRNRNRKPKTTPTDSQPSGSGALQPSQPIQPSQPAQPQQWGQQPRPTQPAQLQQQPHPTQPQQWGQQPRPTQPQQWAQQPRPTPQPTQPQRSQPPQRGQQQPQLLPMQTVSRPSGAVSLYKIPDKVLSPPSRTIPILTNYLALKITKPLKVYRYDVIFKPDRPKKFLGKAFNAAKAKEFPKEIIAFDQIKNVFSLNPLPKISTDRYAVDVVVKDINGKDINFEVSFKASGVVDYNNLLKHMATGGSSLNVPTETIQCIDIVLKQGTLESYVKAGRQFFMRPANPIDLGDGLEMWTGLFQSAIFTSKAFINIDVAHKGFPRSQPMLDALVRDFRLDPKRPLDKQPGRSVDAFYEFLRGLKVVSKIMGNGASSGQIREYLCNGVVDSPTRQTFTMVNENGQQSKITVYDYFLKEKNYRIKYPDLNCLWLGPRDKNIYLPMEVVDVGYGQARNRQLNDRQLSTMVREAATPPDIRKRKIEEVIQKMNYSKDPLYKAFGLEIANEFYQVEAKVLEPPTLEIGPRQHIVPRKGVWQANRLLKPEALTSWGFIAIELDPQRSNYDDIVSKLMSCGRQLGMNVTEPKVTCFNVRIGDLYKSLLYALDQRVNFLVVVVSGRGRDYYHKLKQIAELKVGILTQCIKEDTATRRMSPQTAKNILLKVNSKLMGINQALESRCLPQCIKGGSVMIVGADVTHPSPDQSNVPSIAAVTASIDTKCFIYNIELSVQTPKKEMIVQFEDMMVDHFQAYKKTQGTLPKKVYVFRDGVSEGQFAEVMKSELFGLHRAYQRLAGPNAKPEVLFILVQKRHHTRFFFPGQNARYNVDPGTVVDRDIVHPRELDFYLVSHQAIKGTARPTRYHAVCNDGNIPENEVEQLAYYLCHLYARCMRSVSYPTPTYYAHLACLRARSLTHGETFNNSDLERNPKRLKVLENMLQQSRMFFV